MTFARYPPLEFTHHTSSLRRPESERFFRPCNYSFETRVRRLWDSERLRASRLKYCLPERTKVYYEVDNSIPKLFRESRSVCYFLKNNTKRFLLHHPSILKASKTRKRHYRTTLFNRIITRKINLISVPFFSPPGVDRHK